MAMGGISRQISVWRSDRCTSSSRDSRCCSFVCPGRPPYLLTANPAHRPSIAPRAAGGAALLELYTSGSVGPPHTTKNSFTSGYVKPHFGSATCSWPDKLEDSKGPAEEPDVRASPVALQLRSCVTRLTSVLILVRPVMEHDRLNQRRSHSSVRYDLGSGIHASATERGAAVHRHATHTVRNTTEARVNYKRVYSTSTIHPSMK
ncbi:hypothetical protein C8T65DRAFT_294254 [Cerioporus squamosus]|nr:hypothetical protein C8T65DRAFT_294254 [Cerioporus squamosus]